MLISVSVWPSSADPGGECRRGCTGYVGSPCSAPPSCSSSRSAGCWSGRATGPTRDLRTPARCRRGPPWARRRPSVTSSGPEIQLPKGTKKPRKSRPPKPIPTPLAQPSGPCSPDDVVVAPEVRNPVGGGDVVIALMFRTLVSPACTFEVSAQTITLNITSGNDPIWSTRQCPGAVPTTNVVARKDLATYLFVTWNGKRSDATCSRLTEWALPGLVPRPRRRPRRRTRRRAVRARPPPARDGHHHRHPQAPEAHQEAEGAVAAADEYPDDPGIPADVRGCNP